MGLNKFLSCKNSGFIDTVVSITVTLCVFASQTYLTINSELFVLFLPNKFQTY